jgi:hypothetical protein
VAKVTPCSGRGRGRTASKPRRQAPPEESGGAFALSALPAFANYKLDRLIAFAALRPLAAGFIIGHNEIDVAYPERAGEFK